VRGPPIPSGLTAPTIDLNETEAPARPASEDLSTLVPPSPVERSRGVRFELLEPVGEGAMATVHRAFDHELNRIVAFKVLKPNASTSVTRRLQSEVELTARLDHPGVVPVHGVQTLADGRAGYAMKLVTGRTLRELIGTARHQHAQGNLPDQAHDLDARLGIFLRVCEALAYAHSKGVIHRDVKPDNIMLGSFGEVYLMDWGIARRMVRSPIEPAEDLDAGDEAGAAERHTEVGQVFGTLAYMAPEQARGEVERVDVRTDVFAMGLLLHELVLLRRAYEAKGRDAQLSQARNADLGPPLPAEGCPPGPPELLAISRRATMADPTLRYPTILELAADVERFLRGEATVALPDNRWRRARRWLSRRQGLMITLLAAALPLGALAVASTWSFQQIRLHDQAIHAQHHRVGLTNHQREVARRGQSIESHLLWVEGQLDAIAAAAEYAWARGTPTQRPNWSAADYADPDRAPAGLRDSDAYGKPISQEFAVYTVAPQVADPLWREDLARADGLRELLFEVLGRAPARAADERAGPSGSPPAEDERPIVWAYVALERSGLMYMAPGARGWDEQYDPRTRPWYRSTVGTRGNVWGKPYVDLMGQGRLLSATRALHTPEGGFLGVAGVDLSFEQVIEQLVAAEELPGFRTAWLVDRDGRVMVESTARDASFIVPATEKLDPGIDFGLIRHASVREAALEGRGGQVELEEEDGAILVSWSALPSMGWLYGVEVELEPWMKGSVVP